MLHTIPCRYTYNNLPIMKIQKYLPQIFLVSAINSQNCIYQKARSFNLNLLKVSKFLKVITKLVIFWG